MIIKCSSASENSSMFRLLSRRIDYRCFGALFSIINIPKDCAVKTNFGRLEQKTIKNEIIFLNWWNFFIKFPGCFYKTVQRGANLLFFFRIFRRYRLWFSVTQNVLFWPYCCRNHCPKIAILFVAGIDVNHFAQPQSTFLVWMQ